MSGTNNDYQEFEKSPLALSEETITKFWREHNIFEQSLKQNSPKGQFVFYEGPPTANGRPGIHHLESRAFKDAIPRYKTMQGYQVERRAGWDTHGLPVELEVEKQLGFNGKPDIEKYGISEFNQKCRESVLTYVDEWTAFTDRIAYWLDHENAYYTFTPDYMESVWWVFAQANERGLLYQDYKVLPWCARCGTALSSHELAQGYKDVKDLSVTAKFELLDADFSDTSAGGTPTPKASEAHVKTYILAWTTTPWTLPGNIALAVGDSIQYSVFSIQEDDSEYQVIVATDLAEKVLKGKSYTHLKNILGSDLVGKSYRPLYPYLSNLIDDQGKQALNDQGYQIYSADFVTTNDGTGIVHTAVMYGQDDFELGSRVGLPKFHLVDEEGKFIASTDIFAGRFVKDETVAIDVIKDLAHRGLLFSKEKYEHSYPHCWRCKTPLIYYARESWYIAMSKLRDQLIANNQDINWEPEYIKEGRMGEWLRGIKDWAVSRERYWGTPLPIWQSDDGDRIVIDSVKSLKKYLPQTNFIFIRHGEAENNVLGVADSSPDSKHKLTAKGIGQIVQAVKVLKDQNITPDLVYASDLLRAKQTAEIISDNFGSVPIERTSLINEINFGEFNGQAIDKWKEARDGSDDFFSYRPEGGESFDDVKDRLTRFMNEVATKHQGKTIIVATHGAMLETAIAANDSMSMKEARANFGKGGGVENGSLIKVAYCPLPTDEQGELNLHRPYIDKVVLENNGKKYHRVSEVMDVWFDSGAMPWAQNHFPFNQELSEQEFYETKYPADFISEAIDQTRGWFYVLQAIAAFMDLDQAPYKNVICLGHILDAEGQKMSKSRGNTVNPWEMIAKYGADALRFWMYSVNQPGEPKNFDEQTVDEIVKKVFNLLRNSNTFYQLFAEHDHADDPFSSPSALDQWILARLGQTINEVTVNSDDYKLLEATRSIREFIGDLSQWYIRRSRDRFKGSNETDRSYALATARFVIKTTAQLLAPFTPYLAEEIWQTIRSNNDPISVHLSNWPDKISIDNDLINNMAKIRELASVGLALRSDNNINLRQPLQSLTIPKNNTFSDNILQILAEEVNVKEIIIAGDQVLLDTNITSELSREGEIRDIIRSVQTGRKELDLVPNDQIKLIVDESVLELMQTYQDQLAEVAGVSEIITSNDGDYEFRSQVNSVEYKFLIKRK